MSHCNDCGCAHHECECEERAQAMFDRAVAKAEVLETQREHICEMLHTLKIALDEGYGKSTLHYNIDKIIMRVAMFNREKAK